MKVCETPKHVAEIGGWSLRQVQKWCADGTLPAMMIGGTWAISGQKICDMLGIED
ncbi:helix-turn-helix domain-containing protein [Collinsella sp. AF20-14LB]|uniref:helix-turn-helix domain-containing protein n=1 Tax=Collinsella sp. AF20-14LB TaxID=2292221 RepID=UPI000E5484AE|nr:helix-turn-helix domain-containing protein [Collinsella sp. AF20-14LB]RGS93511.1 DNA-binding protein [Collinsella sp. AF20-14LB]RHB19897.1 DNA-binding protein [Collinsella sp. AM40-7AC]RHC91326.1 DNA-binding protein [Collinsella sp. AM34-10]